MNSSARVLASPRCLGGVGDRHLGVSHPFSGYFGGETDDRNADHDHRDRRRRTGRQRQGPTHNYPHCRWSEAEVLAEQSRVNGGRADLSGASGLQQYQGIESFEIGSGIIKEVQTNNASVSPSQAPQSAPPPAQAQPPQTTPMGVVSAGAGSKDRSIQALAIIKAVVAVGGTEGEVQRWMDCHDRLVAGEQVG